MKFEEADEEEKKVKDEHFTFCWYSPNQINMDKVIYL